MNANEIINLLDSLAEKLTPAAQHVFEIAVRQVVIDGFWNILMLVALGVIWAIFAFWTRKVLDWTLEQAAAQKNRSRDYYSHDFDVVGARALLIGLPAFVLGLITVASVPVLLSNAVSYIFNPEWQVILRLSELVPGA